MDLSDFVRESNRIEGIVREPTRSEVEAHERFLASDPSIPALIGLVEAVQPDARLRDRVGLDVRVGAFLPPPGGPEVAEKLRELLHTSRDPYWTHHLYETLHPFTDGNGRSGRALWLAMMGGIINVPLGFLHHWYYQSLADGTLLISRARPDLRILWDGPAAR